MMDPWTGVPFAGPTAGSLHQALLPFSIILHRACSSLCAQARAQQDNSQYSL